MSRWTFTDPQTAEVRTFALNPNAGGTPTREKTFTVLANPAVDALNNMIFQGRDKPDTGEFDGAVRTQAEFEAMNHWFDDKPYVIAVTDDLGRTFDILITDLTVVMAPTITAPWRHTYTCQYVTMAVAT